MTINYCNFQSQEFQPDAFELNECIKNNTNCQEFNLCHQRLADHRLTYGGVCGWNALGTAAFQGNVPLIYHIVQIGGKELLHLGNSNGWTPLYCAANCPDPENGFLTAKALLSLGAKINTATSLSSFSYYKGYTPKMATPLWAAASKAQNLNLVKLLLINGGAIDMTTTSGFFDPLYGEDRFPLPLINQATAELREDGKIWRLFRVSQRNTTGVKLPPALIFLIGKYFYGDLRIVRPEPKPTKSPLEEKMLDGLFN